MYIIVPEEYEFISFNSTKIINDMEEIDSDLLKNQTILILKNKDKDEKVYIEVSYKYLLLLDEEIIIPINKIKISTKCICNSSFNGDMDINLNKLIKYSGRINKGFPEGHGICTYNNIEYSNNWKLIKFK